MIYVQNILRALVIVASFHVGSGTAPYRPIMSYSAGPGKFVVLEAQHLPYGDTAYRLRQCVNHRFSADAVKLFGIRTPSVRIINSNSGRVYVWVMEYDMSTSVTFYRSCSTGLLQLWSDESKGGVVTRFPSRNSAVVFIGRYRWQTTAVRQAGESQYVVQIYRFKDGKTRHLSDMDPRPQGGWWPDPRFLKFH